METKLDAEHKRCLHRYGCTHYSVDHRHPPAQIDITIESEGPLSPLSRYNLVKHALRAQELKELPPAPRTRAEVTVV